MKEPFAKLIFPQWKNFWGGFSVEVEELTPTLHFSISVQSGMKRLSFKKTSKKETYKDGRLFSWYYELYDID